MKRVIMSTYQAASGAGAPGMSELEDGCKAIATGGKAENNVFAHPLPFNVIPHIDKFLDDKYTKEERKVHAEHSQCLVNVALSMSPLRMTWAIGPGTCYRLGYKARPYDESRLIPAKILPPASPLLISKLDSACAATWRHRLPSCESGGPLLV